MYFEYGEKETEYLKKHDKKLGAAIDKIGHIYRECDDDLFTSVVRQIVGQQISAPAFKTVWNRVVEKVGDINADSICSISDDELQSCGLSYRKVDYIKDFANKVRDKTFDVEKLEFMTEFVTGACYNKAKAKVCLYLKRNRRDLRAVQKVGK